MKKNNIQKCISWCEKHDISSIKLSFSNNIFLSNVYEDGTPVSTSRSHNSFLKKKNSTYTNTTTIHTAANATNDTPDTPDSIEVAGCVNNIANIMNTIEAVVNMTPIEPVEPIECIPVITEPVHITNTTIDVLDNMEI